MAVEPQPVQRLEGASRGLEIPDYLLGGILHAVSNYVREHRADNRRPVPPHVLAAHRWLTIMSQVGHESSSDETTLDADDLIGTAQAASLLGCTERHVRRLRADLDGVRPSGGSAWVFSRHQVVRYAQARRDHRELAERSDQSTEQ